MVKKVLYSELAIYLVSFDPSIDISVAISELRSFRDILYIQRNHRVEERTTEPDDPDFPLQWHHQNIESSRAWDITTGGEDPLGREIVIAILDSGFDTNHEDFVENLWTNDDEIPNDNIDNDNNGFIDDYNGWNFESDNDVHNVASTHGTNVAGIAGAKGNNDKGVSGVVWDVKLLFMSGLASDDKIIEANAYIAETRKRYNETGGKEGAYIVASNLSLGIRFGFAEDFAVWCNQYNQMGKLGILNVCATDNLDSDVDIKGDMPSTCSSEYLISVTNTDLNNNKTERAAFGNISVDIGAPGTDNFTTSPYNNYNSATGTSVSSPLVAGAIALLYSAPCNSIAERAISNPGDVALTMKNIIFSGLTPSASLNGTTTQGGVLNVWESMLALEKNCESNSGLEENQLSILKNPIDKANDDIIMDLVAVQDGGEVYIRIFDAKGAMLIEKLINRSFFGSNRIRIPVDNRFVRGIYMVSLMLEDKSTHTQKLVVY